MASEESPRGGRTAAARAAALLAVALVGCAGAQPGVAPGSPPDAQPASAELWLQSDLQGVIEPCGCTVELHAGGLARLAGLLRSRPAEVAPFLLDAGDLLTASLPVPERRRAQEAARGELLLDVLQTLPLGAATPGELDLALGAEDYRRAVQRRALPVVASNLLDATGTPAFAPWRMLAAGPLRIGILGLLAPELLAAVPAAAREGWTARPCAEALAEHLPALQREAPDLVIVLGHLPRRALRQLAEETSGGDIWVLGHATQDGLAPEVVGHALLLEGGPRGNSLLRIDLPRQGPAPEQPWRLAGGRDSATTVELNARVERLRRRMERLPAGSEVRHTQEAELARLEAHAKSIASSPAAGEPGSLGCARVVLDETAPLDATVDAQRQAFNARLRALNLAAQPTTAPAGPSPYAGSAACAECHESQAEQWQTTRHAHAVASLEARGKEFDDECIGCHVVGYGEPGGARLGALGELANVGCEACHGPAAAHARAPESGSPSAAVPSARCERCHVPEHSPRYDYRAYLPRVLGPGHGG